jgi:hypothetical protein
MQKHQFSSPKPKLPVKLLSSSLVLAEGAVVGKSFNRKGLERESF